MLELSPARKNKINLADYNCQQDIENRMLMADFSTFEHSVLEEVLFSPLKFSLKKLARSVGCKDEAELTPILKKLANAGLLSIQEDTVWVDKDLRKYFEFQITRFDPEFKPDMEFLQGILRKVPIPLLPVWYAIPRTSNNIFESIVEKYLLTPQSFHRYLGELNLGDPILCGIIQDVFSAPDFKISSSDLIAKYNLSRPRFEEILLFLEFSFVCCLSYEKEDNHWLESVTPFYEWHEYLRFLKATEATPIPKDAPILRHREKDFAFIEDLTTLLHLAKKKPLPSPSNPVLLAKALAPLLSLSLDDPTTPPYIESLVNKLCLLQLATQDSGSLTPLEAASSWFEMTPENRALYLYRHPMNQILTPSLPPEIATERHIREAEKSIKRVLHGEWVFFDEFLRGVLVPLSEESVLMLKRVGKHWKYVLPTYTDAEKDLIRATLFSWLFEMGMVVTGSCQGRDCFAVTPFGRFFFEE